MFLPHRGPTLGMVGPQFEYRMVRDGKYKYVQFRDAPELLFDLEADPHEQQNLAPEAEGQDREALEYLRDYVDDGLDFDVVDEKRARHHELTQQFQLGASQGGPNQYHLPDGRVIDADTPLYQPHVITERPDIAFDDYPDSND